MMRLLVGVLCCFHLSVSHAIVLGPSEPSKPVENNEKLAQASRRTIAVAQIQGVLLALESIAKVDYDLNSDTNGEEYNRLYDFFNYTSSIRVLLKQSVSALTKDTFALARLNRMIQQIETIAEEHKEVLDNEVPDDHSDLVDRLDESREAVAKIVQEMSSFIHDLHPEMTENTPEVKAPEASISPTNENSANVLRNLAQLHGLRMQLDAFATMTVVWELNDDHSEDYAEYYTLVSTLVALNKRIQNSIQNLKLDPNAKIILEEASVELTSRIEKAENRFLDNSDLEVTDHDWDQHLSDLQEKIKQLGVRLDPLIALYEEQALATIATLESTIAMVQEHPEQFEEAARLAVNTLAAEIQTAKSELASVSTALDEAQRAVQEATRLAAAAREQHSAKLADIAIAAEEEQRLATQIASHRQELASREEAIRAINATVPTLQELVAQVLGANSFGLTNPTQVTFENVDAQEAKLKLMKHLQANLASRLDTLILQMRADHQAEFDKILASKGLTDRNFNISARIIIDSPKVRGGWFTFRRKAVYASAILEVRIDAPGVAQAALTNGFHRTQFRLDSKTGHMDDKKIVAYINEKVPAMIAKTLEAANPQIAGLGDMQQIVTTACENILSQYAATVQTVSGGN